MDLARERERVQRETNQCRCQLLNNSCIQQTENQSLLHFRPRKTAPSEQFWDRGPVGFTIPYVFGCLFRIRTFFFAVSEVFLGGDISFKDLLFGPSSGKAGTSFQNRRVQGRGTGRRVFDLWGV